jgi:hypothetical protein
VLRGGSWNNNQNNARCANRNNNHPDNRNNNIGFRVVVGSHNFPQPAGNAVRLRLDSRGHVLSKHAGELARPVPGRSIPDSPGLVRR